MENVKPTADRSTYCRDISERLFAAERSADVALADAALFMAELAEGRMKLGVSAETSQSSIARVVGGMNDLVAGREKFVETHRELKIIGQRLGFSPVDWGDGGAKPVKGFSPDLRVVSDQ